MEYLYKQEYDLSHTRQNIELILYSAVCFLAPLLLGHPQWLIGTLVNAALILTALNLKGYKLLPVILLPSIGVLTAGLIFGSFTMFLVYMVPFIWVGNAILVFAFKKLNLGMKINRWYTLAIGGVVKMAFLFLAAFVMVQLAILPPLFLTAMGLFQLYTALAGGVLAFTVQYAKKQI